MQGRDQPKYTKQEHYKSKRRFKEKNTDNMQPHLYSHYAMSIQAVLQLGFSSSLANKRCLIDSVSSHHSHQEL